MLLGWHYQMAWQDHLHPSVWCHSSCQACLRAHAFKAHDCRESLVYWHCSSHLPVLQCLRGSLHFRRP